MHDITRLRDFIQSFTRLVDEVGDDEQRIFDDGRRLLADLIQHDDWLPGPFDAPHTDGYQQYLLHCDPWERFSVMSLVFAPGQRTPVHDHTVWGMVGLMRGAERCEEYVNSREPPGLVARDEHAMTPGDIDVVSPRVGDIHKVFNSSDAPSVSIHVYGGNIGAIRRRVYDTETGDTRTMISGYSNATMPNVWDRSGESVDFGC